jgi:hypothetical protein
MKTNPASGPVLLAVCAALAGVAGPGRAGPAVTVRRAPDGGIQPQAAVDGRGTLHLIYFKGDPRAGDLFYVRRESGKERFSKPLRVNSRPGSAVAIGSVRGGQLALGKGGRVHVAWNSSGKTGTPEHFPMFYARLNDAGTAFEEQRDLMRASGILDGGGTVAADGAGNVYVVWQGLARGGKRGEENRRPWVARSTDGGKTFSREAAAWETATGACGCCSTRAFADRKGNVYFLYRGANEGVFRDAYLLVSTDRGKSFRGALLQRWKVTA